MKLKEKGMWGLEWLSRIILFSAVMAIGCTLMFCAIDGLMIMFGPWEHHNADYEKTYYFNNGRVVDKYQVCISNIYACDFTRGTMGELKEACEEGGYEYTVYGENR